MSILPDIVRHHGEPFADPSAIPTHYLAALTRNRVTVALNGDGGDESFGGYSRYVANSVAARLDLLPRPLRRALAFAASGLGNHGDVGEVRNKLRRLGGAMALGEAERYGAYMSWIGRDARAALYTADFAAQVGHAAGDTIAAAFEAASGGDVVDRMLEVDVNTYLVGDLIAKVDIATMAHGLEARSPLLDPELMQFAASLPARMKVRGREKKWILRRALRGTLPDDLLDRPKQGFSVPLSTWLRGDLRPWAAEILLDRETIGSRVLPARRRRRPAHPPRRRLRCPGEADLGADHARALAPRGDRSDRSLAAESPRWPEMTDVMTRRDEEVEVLETTARRALWWSVANNVVGRVGTTLIGIVLARILSPEDYGVYAVALVVLNILLSMNELGVSMAIVRRRGDVSEIAPTVGTLSLATSLLMWLIIFATAPLVADALGVADASGVIRVLALAIIIDALTAVPAALMTRDFMQKERLIVDSAGFVVTSVVVARPRRCRRRAWALVWGALLGNLVNAAFILRYAPHRYGFGFRTQVARELLGFGLPLAAASLLIIALLEIDYIVIGAELGAVSLGFYLLAFNLSTWPVNMFSAPARRISLPLFARLHNGETSASDAFVPVCCALLLVTLPACVLLAVFAEPTRPAGIRRSLDAFVRGSAMADGPRLHPRPRRARLRLPRRPRNVALEPLPAGDLARRPDRHTAGGGAPRRDRRRRDRVTHAWLWRSCCRPTPSSCTMPASPCGASPPSCMRPLAGGVLGAAAGICAVELIGDGIVAQIAIGGALVAGIYVVVVYPMRAMLTAPLAGSV